MRSAHRYPEQRGTCSGGGVRVNRQPPEVVGGRQSVEGEYGAQSVRWDRKNQDLLSCLEHVCLIWIRSANSHTGQQPELRKQAGQMTPLSNPRSRTAAPLCVYGRRRSDHTNAEQAVMSAATARMAAGSRMNIATSNRGRGTMFLVCSM